VLYISVEDVWEYQFGGCGMECCEVICLEKRGVTFWEETSGVKRGCKRIVR